MERFNKVVDAVYLFFMAFALFFMVGVIVWQVFARYVLNQGTLIAEEAVALAMVWISMLGTSYAFYQRKHMMVGLIKDKLPLAIHKNLDLFSDIVSLFATVILHLIGGMIFVNLTKNQTMATIPTSVIVLNISMVVSGVLTTVFLSILIVQNIRNRRSA